MTQTELSDRGPALAARQAAPSSTHLGGWRLAGEPAVGRFAHVFPARPATASDAQPACYAIKLLQTPYDAEPGAIRRLAREALVGRRVRHAHVVPVLASNLAEPPRYVVMPWLSGATVAQQLAEGHSLSLPEALWIARQAAAGLAALHASGYTHGDIKPANIFVSPLGHVTLIDLGFARRFDEPVDAEIVGTAEYMAPERRRGRSAPGGREDIYSLGRVLLELLASGNALNDGPSDSKDRLAQSQRLVNSMVGLPSGARSLLAQMLANDPLRRPQTADEIVRRLTSLEIETFPQRAWA